MADGNKSQVRRSPQRRRAQLVALSRQSIELKRTSRLKQKTKKNMMMELSQQQLGGVRAKRPRINRGSCDDIDESSSVECTDLKKKKKKNLESEGAVPESRREEDKSDAEEAGPSVVRFSDFGGIDKVIEELNKEVIVPFSNHKLGAYLLGKPMPMPGILLSGPPGCGKTKLAHAIANETSSTFHKISAPSLVSSFTGGSEDMIRRLFHKAYQTAPSVVFIDEIDVIASKREDLKVVDCLAMGSLGIFSVRRSHVSILTAKIDGIVTDWINLMKLESARTFLIKLEMQGLN
ncbi:hypothetical protein ABKV19_019957 [Rosa sericea]